MEVKGKVLNLIGFAMMDPKDAPYIVIHGDNLKKTGWFSVYF